MDYLNRIQINKIVLWFNIIPRYFGHMVMRWYRHIPPILRVRRSFWLTLITQNDIHVQAKNYPFIFHAHTFLWPQAVLRYVYSNENMTKYIHYLISLDVTSIKFQNSVVQRYRPPTHHYRSMENQYIIKHGFGLASLCATPLSMVQMPDVLSH